MLAPATAELAYNSSTVPTFHALLEGATHFEPVGAAGRELAPTIAWLRLQVFDDQGGRDYFYDASCKLCTAPWTAMSKDLQ